VGSEVGYSLEEVSSCVSFVIPLRRTLTTAESHEVRCSVPRHLVEVVELVGDLRNGCAEDCLGVDIYGQLSSHIVATTRQESPTLSSATRNMPSSSDTTIAARRVPCAYLSLVAISSLSLTRSDGSASLLEAVMSVMLKGYRCWTRNDWTGAVLGMIDGDGYQEVVCDVLLLYRLARMSLRSFLDIVRSSQFSSETNMCSYCINTHSSELADSVRCSSEFMQVKCQGSVGRIGLPLSATLLLHTSVWISDAEKHTSRRSCTVRRNSDFSVGPSCRSRIIAIVPFGNGRPPGRTHGTAKEDQARRA
jgi:hypothetical protein